MLVEIEMLTLLPLLHSHGAIISRDLNCDVTHVVVSATNPLRHAMIEVRLGDRGRGRLQQIFFHALCL
jgi:hypothetical protein